MAKVKILDDIVVNQIAAGEVVERPASVVKELVENSIDAGASEIHIVIANGGRSSIEVIDNGCGMTKSDALLAIERFGTSKIKDIEDIQKIATLGFRGEAMPSIASVSRFSLNSYAAGEKATKGVEIQIEGGVIREVIEKDSAPGTKVQVKNLFFNVPARRRFLRSEKTEAGLIKALIADLALSFPNLRFRLVSDGKEVSNFSKAANFFERARQLKLFSGDPVVVEEKREIEEGEIGVKAFLSTPAEAVSSALRLRLIVNGRSVRDKLLLRAVRDSYGTFLKPGKYPVGVLKLEVPPSEVDVNVHPQKSEVRFRTSDLIYSTIFYSIKKSLSETRSLETSFEKLGAGSVIGLGQRTQSADSDFGSRWQMRGSQSAGNFFNGFREAASEQIVFEGNAVPKPQEQTARLSQMRYLGQILHCYLLLEGPEMLCLVDMHAAHERVTFYNLKKQFVEKKVASQNLLIPELVNLPSDRIAQFEEFQAILSELGIDAELFSDDQVAVRALPAALGGVSAESIFSELCALPAWSNWKEALEVKIDRIISRLACHGSVRSGRDLKPEEVYRLLENLEQAEASAFCPHGRPIVRKFSAYELECMFERS